MNNASCKELLAGNKWILDKSDDFSGFSEDVLRRYIPNIKHEDLDALVVFLKTWTDEKNYTIGATPESPVCATVTTPMVHHGKIRSGVWYGGRITYDWVTSVDGTKTLNLYQVLYKGNVTVSNVETENNCAYKVATTYYFKTASLATLPESDPLLAINYERGGVSRDSETGAYTYWIAKRTRLYQKISEYTSQIDAAEKVLSTHHDGVKYNDKNDSGVDIGLNPMTAAIDGEQREQRRAKNSDCSSKIDEVRRQITDQTATGSGTSDRKVISAAETITEEAHTAAAAAVGDPTLNDGEMIEVVNKPTQYKNRIATVKQTRSIIDQTATGSGVSDLHMDSGDETIDEERHTAKSTAEPDVPATIGVIVTTESDPLPYKNRFRTRKRTETAKYRHDSISWTDRSGTSYLYWGINATDEQFDQAITDATLTAATKNDIDFRPSRFPDLFNYTITKLAYIGGTSSGESAQDGTQNRIQYGYVYDDTEERVMRMRRKVTQKWYLTWHPSYSAAYNVAGDGYQGSRIVQSGGLFGAITLGEPSEDVWNSDE